MNLCIMPRWWLHRSFIFTLTWRNDPIWLTNMFQMGWNDYLDEFFWETRMILSKILIPWLMTHESECQDSLVALLSTREQSHISIPNLAQLRQYLLGPILPKARNRTHEKMKLPKGKLYSNLSGEQREKTTWLFTYTGNYNYLSYFEIITHHYKDPY